MGAKENSITHFTRRNIIDFMSIENIFWSGRLGEPDFVARVWPGAHKFPSYDSRFGDALSDIHQHREFNHDWEDDWIFTDARFNLLGGSDEKFLDFLAEVVHPVVRSDKEEIAKLVAAFNDHLKDDGYMLVQTSHLSGYPVYGGSLITAKHTPATALNLHDRTLLDDHSALLDHLNAIERAITVDPAGAIASAKELVESLYKLILDKRGVEYATKDDLPALYKKVATELALKKESVPDSAKGSEAAHKILGALNTTVFGLSELRNQIGRGHGRSTASPAFHRHARLAFNAAVALSEFLYDTLQDREGGIINDFPRP